MADLILSETHVFSLLDSAEPFPVDFDDAWRWVKYSTKQKAEEALRSSFEEGSDFLTLGLKSSTGGRKSRNIRLSVDCLKSFAMMAGTTKGKDVRKYFIEVEKQWKADRLNPPALTKDQIRALLCRDNPDVWSKRFGDNYYEQLSRLTGLVQTGNARPYHWANLTIELFYCYLPGELTLVLKTAKKKNGDWQKLHQFLTEDGRKTFAAHIDHLLTTMRDADSVNDVRRALRNHYGNISQGEFFLDNRKDGKLTLRRDLIVSAELN